MFDITVSQSYNHIDFEQLSDPALLCVLHLMEKMSPTDGGISATVRLSPEPEAKPEAEPEKGTSNDEPGE